MTTRHDPKLDAEGVAQSLERLPLWNVEEGRLRRTYKFADFATAFGWMSACALVAEKLDHHPDWSNAWSKVDVELTTHSAGGLTELDFTLAQKMEDLASKLGGL